jgi:hypothetical protein
MTTRVTASTLANTAVTTGTYGGASQVPVVVVDQQGRLTSAANVTVAINATQVSNNQYYQISANTSNSLVSGSWEIKQDGTKLKFTYGGVLVFSIDSSGNVIAKADVSGFGTP